jgi:hypothetical protein
MRFAKIFGLISLAQHIVPADLPAIEAQRR